MTTAQLLAAGVSARSLSGPRFRQLFHGTHMTRLREPTLADWLAAACLVLPDDCVPAGRTAFQALGVDAGPLLPVVFATPEPRRVQRVGLRVVSRRPGREPLQAAWLEVCRQEPLMDAVVMGDRCLFRGVCTPDFFRHAWPSAAARRAAGLVRAGSESWAETRLRLCLVAAGLPEPELNVVVHGQLGQVVGRVDMLFREAKVVVEYDGEQHRLDDQQYHRDVVRLADLQREGYLVVRVDRLDMRDPWAVVIRVAEALRSRGVAVRPRPTALWCQVFRPGQAA